MTSPVSAVSRQQLIDAGAEALCEQDAMAAVSDRTWESAPERVRQGYRQAVAAAVDAVVPLIAADLERRSDRHMRDRHVPEEREVLSGFHYDSEHDSEDVRCSDACFERMTLCRCCGSAFPCLEIRAWDAVVRGFAAEVTDRG